MEAGRVRVRRVFGLGPCYVPETRKVIPEGGEYDLPEAEAWDRRDWEVIDEDGNVLSRPVAPEPEPEYILLPQTAKFLERTYEKLDEQLDELPEK